MVEVDIEILLRKAGSSNSSVLHVRRHIIQVWYIHDGIWKGERIHDPLCTFQAAALVN
jgi:hypothetical protein